MRFEWDENKNKINILKHKVSFEEAKTVFYDDDALIEYDEENSIIEDRFNIVGESNLQRILIVCHCIRNNDTIRIITARTLNHNEIIFYKKRMGGKL